MGLGDKSTSLTFSKMLRLLFRSSAGTLHRAAPSPASHLMAHLETVAASSEAYRSQTPLERMSY